MRNWLLTVIAVCLLSGSTGCLLPGYSADPARRAQQLIYTSENLRQMLDEWERIWFLDQPSQVYFPPENDVDGSFSGVGEDDRQAVSRMFRFVFDVVEELAPGFQVVITEHADISEQWYQNAVVERWRGGPKLVPEDWPRNGSSEEDE